MVGLISLNYKVAPIELREKFYLDDAQKIVFHNLLKKHVGVEGLMLISTCNRTEIYIVTPDDFTNSNNKVLDWLTGYHQLMSTSLDSYYYTYENNVSNLLFMSNVVSSIEPLNSS